MNHIVLLSICILSVEVFIRSKFLVILDSILKVTKKVIHVIPQDNISDHWKEKVIPAYASRIMKFSVQILLIVLLIGFLFVIASQFLNGFLELTLSFFGIIESMMFSFGYVYLRKALIK